MTTRLRENGVAIAGAAAGIAVLAWLGLTGFAWTDYDDEAAAAFKALTDGHVGRALELAPSYGGSLVLRAPFVAVTGLLGGGELAVFRVGSLAMLALTGVFGVWLVWQLRQMGAGKLARAVALGLCVASPITLSALDYGHPEELLVVVAAVAAVIAAGRGKVTWAGVLLGVAIASKAWALIAVGPVLVALPAQRVRCAAIAAGAALLLLAPLLIAGASGGQFAHINRAVATGSGGIFHPWQVWWWTGASGVVIHAHTGDLIAGYRAPPSWLGPIPRPLIVVLAAALSFAWLRRSQERTRGDALLLLALVSLLRCVLDPWNISYYALPFLFALLAWEVLVAKRAPLLALAATAITWLLLQKAITAVSPDLESLAYLAFAVPALLAMGLRLYAPARFARLGARFNRVGAAPIGVRRLRRAT